MSKGFYEMESKMIRKAGDVLGKDKKNGGSANPVVSRAFCDERFQRSLDQINSLKESIDEAKQATVDKSDELKEEIKKLKSDKEEESHFWRNFLGTIVGGGLVAVIGFLVSRLHF